MGFLPQAAVLHELLQHRIFSTSYNPSGIPPLQMLHGPQFLLKVSCGIKVLRRLQGNNTLTPQWFTQPAPVSEADSPLLSSETLVSQGCFYHLFFVVVPYSSLSYSCSPLSKTYSLRTAITLADKGLSCILQQVWFGLSYTLTYTIIGAYCCQNLNTCAQYIPPSSLRNTCLEIS